MNEVVWKQIPLYSRYEASNTGRVRAIDSRREITQFENTTDVGTYLIVTLFRDDGVRRRVYVHRLVCKAFHGLHPDYLKTDVNHKDTDKHNNHESNLEWASRSANVTHAYQTGARTDSMRVIMHDHLTGQDTEFHSMSALATALGLKHKKGFHHAQRHREKKYLDRYTFTILGNYTSPKRVNAVPVYFVDYKTASFSRFEDIGQLSLITGIKRSTAQMLVNANEPRLLNGCLIRRIGDAKFLEFAKTVTQEMVNESVGKYSRFLKLREERTTTKQLLDA